MYKILNTRTKESVSSKQFKTRKAARKLADRFDQDYGACVYVVIYSEDKEKTAIYENQEK